MKTNLKGARKGIAALAFLLSAVLQGYAGTQSTGDPDGPPTGSLVVREASEEKAVAELTKQFNAAYRKGDAKRLRSIMIQNYRRLKKSEPERVKEELRLLSRLDSTVDLAGPALTYALALQSQDELPREARVRLDETLANLVSEATLNPRSELACLRAQQRLLEELARGDRPVSQELWLENLACDSEMNTPRPITLRDGLVLDAIDAPASFVYLFDPPPSIPAGFSARIDPEPPQPVVFDSDGRQLVLQTLPLREVPADFRTQVYRITLTDGGSDSVYTVVLPVNLGMQVPLLPVLVPAASIEITLPASGGPLDCAALPSGVQLPCGPVTWQWVPDAGSGPLPAGISLIPLPEGHARLVGTVQVGAISSSGRLRLQQAGQTIERPRSLAVAVHLAAGEPAALLGPHALTRGETFSLRLPQALGGDGRNYQWSVASAGPPLPPAVQLVRRGNEVWLAGRLDETAPLGRHSIQLWVESPLAPAPSLFTSHLDIGHRLRVWTQNSFLRPPDVFPASFYIETTALLLSPLDAPFASSLLSAAAIVEAAYDLKVKNTSGDNTERLEMILERAAEFDIVALQEVFEEDRAEQLINGALAGGFFPLPGPEGSVARLPTNLSTGAAQAALPKTSAGLFLLVRRDLYTPTSNLGGLAGQLAAETLRLAAFNHSTQVFTACNGFLGEGSDCLARKGFTLSTVRVGSNPDEFLFVVNTHLDAGGTPADVAARASQLAQIATFIAGATDGVHPILFMGDFNIVGEVGSPATAGPELPTLVGALGGVDLYRLAHPLVVGARVGYTVDSAVNAYANQWGDHDPNNPTRERLDYLRVVQGSGFRLMLESIAVMGDPLDPREEPRTRNCYDPDLLSDGWVEANVSLRCYFSDHYGVEAVLRLERVPPSP